MFYRIRINKRGVKRNASINLRDQKSNITYNVTLKNVGAGKSLKSLAIKSRFLRLTLVGQLFEKFRKSGLFS